MASEDFQCSGIPSGSIGNKGHDNTELLSYIESNIQGQCVYGTQFGATSTQHRNVHSVDSSSENYLIPTNNITQHFIASETEIPHHHGISTELNTIYYDNSQYAFNLHQQQNSANSEKKYPSEEVTAFFHELGLEPAPQTHHHFRLDSFQQNNTVSCPDHIIKHNDLNCIDEQVQDPELCKKQYFKPSQYSGIPSGSIENKTLDNTKSQSYIESDIQGRFVYGTQFGVTSTQHHNDHSVDSSSENYLIPTNIITQNFIATETALPHHHVISAELNTRCNNVISKETDVQHVVCSNPETHNQHGIAIDDHRNIYLEETTHNVITRHFDTNHPVSESPVTQFNLQRNTGNFLQHHYDNCEYAFNLHLQQNSANSEVKCPETSEEIIAFFPELALEPAPQTDHQFKQKGRQNTHTLTHTAGKIHKCKFCEKKFPFKSSLKCHLLSHTGQKPYKCDYCEKRCTQKGNLNQHLLTHTGQKPYKCDYCERRFTQKSHLNRHLLHHTGKSLHV